MTPRLISRGADGTVRSIPCSETARIGTARDGDVVLTGADVAPLHARIRIEDDRAWIEDARSPSGTWVNGERLSSRRALRHLDVITLGSSDSVVVLLRDGKAPAHGPVKTMARSADLDGRTIVAPQGVPPPPPRLDAGTVARERVSPPARPPALDGRTVVGQPGAAPPAPPAELDGRTVVGRFDMAPKSPPPGLDGRTVTRERAPLPTPPAALDKRTVLGPAGLLPPSPPKGLDLRSVARARVPIKAPPASSDEPTLVARPGLLPSPNDSRVRFKLTGPAGTFESGPGRCIVGRDSAATFQIDSKNISRRHAEITITPNGIHIEDLGSSNGTKVNGQVICGRTELFDGDDVMFASFMFQVKGHRTRGAV